MQPRLRPVLSVLATTAMTLALALGPAARAQNETTEPTPGPFCALLTADEVSTALGAAMTPTEGSELDCAYAGDMEAGIFVSLYTRVDGGTLESIKIGWPDGEGLDIGGTSAWYVEDLLWTEIGGRLLTLQLVSFQSDAPDHKAALISLAKIAVGRWDSLSIPEATPEPTAEPMPSFVGDQELVDLFPDEIGGVKVDVLSFTGQELLANASGDDGEAAVKQITDVLTSLGKTIDDVSFGFASVSKGATGVLLVALRVRGADATAFAPLVMPLFESEFLDSFSDPTQTPTQVGSRDVIMVTDGPPSDTGNKAYVYARNDIVWLVAVLGTDVAIEDVLGALP
jgi:hypothetical protein